MATTSTPTTTPGHIAAGLSKTEYAALKRAGAFGAHPIQFLILGDSIALTLGIGLSHLVKANYGLNISNHASLGCDLDPNLEVITSGVQGPATLGCENWRAQWPFLVASVHPQVVALGVGRWEISDHLLDGQWVHIGEPLWDNHLTSDLDYAISIFTLFGAKVVLFTMPFIDPSNRQPNGLPYPENTPARVDLFNRLVEKVARAHPKVTVIGLNHLLSPHGVFTMKVDGVRARWFDGIHITTLGAEALQPKILPEIDRLGLEVEQAQNKDKHESKKTNKNRNKKS